MLQQRPARTLPFPASPLPATVPTLSSWKVVGFLTAEWHIPLSSCILLRN